MIEVGRWTRGLAWSILVVLALDLGLRFYIAVELRGLERDLTAAKTLLQDTRQQCALTPWSQAFHSARDGSATY